MRDISAELDVAVSTISKVLRVAGVEIRAAGKAPTNPDIDWEQVGADYQAGLAVSVLLGKHRIGLNMLYQILNELGIPTRSKLDKKYRQLRLDAAVLLYERGETTSNILNETGIYPADMYHELDRLGIPRRQKKYGRQVGAQLVENLLKAGILVKAPPIVAAGGETDQGVRAVDNSAEKGIQPSNQPPGDADLQSE